MLVNDEKTTYQVQAAEGVEVVPHLNHRVELTGTVEKTDSSLVIKAKALKDGVNVMLSIDGLCSD